MGLLDDPRQAGLLTLGLGLLNSRGSFGNALGSAGQQAYGAMVDASMRQRMAKADEQRQKMLEQQLAMQQLQMQMAQEKQARAAAAEQNRLGYLKSTSGEVGPPEPFNMPRALQYLGADEAKLLAPQGPEYKTVGPSLVRMDPQGPQEVFRSPDKASQSSLAKLLDEMSGLAPDDPRRAIYVDAIKKATTHQPGTNVTVKNVQETEEAKVVGKGYGEMYLDAMKGERTARTKMANLDRMSQYLRGMETGKFTPTAKSAAEAAAWFGIQLDPRLDDKQAFDALSKEMAMQMRNPSGGAGMPGAMSDKDREFLEKTVPNLANTPGGNAKIIEVGRKVAQRDVEVAKKMREWRAKHGRITDEFWNELSKWADANPLFAGVTAAPVVVGDDPLGLRGR